MLGRIVTRIFVFPMRWRVVLVALFAICTQAFVPAPIRWAQDKRFALAPSISVANFPTAFQPLLMRDDSDVDSPNQIPSFAAHLDQTIAWESAKMCLEATGDQSGDPIGVNHCTGSPTQLWNFVPLDHARSQIQLKGSQKCVDIDESKGALNGVPIKLQDCGRKSAKAWIFEEQIPIPTQTPLQNSVLSSSVRHAIIAFVVMAVLGASGLRAWLYHRRIKASTLPTYQGDLSLDVQHTNLAIEANAVGFAPGTHLGAYSSNGFGLQGSCASQPMAGASGIVGSRSLRASSPVAVEAFRTRPPMMQLTMTVEDTRKSSASDSQSVTSVKGNLMELETTEEVINEMEAQGPAIIVWAMKACRGCRKEEPKVRRLAREHGDVRFLRVTFNKETKPAFEKYDVKSTPTMMLKMPGEERRLVTLDELLDDFPVSA